MMISARARRAPEPKEQKFHWPSEVLDQSQPSWPGEVGWVHRKHEEWGGRGELERVSAIEKIKQYKPLSLGKDRLFDLSSD
jgi:hypothetical protein